MESEKDEVMDIEKGELFKSKGNTHYSAKNYVQAIEQYNKAISYNQDASYYANRAACYLALKKYLKCIDDCDKALKIDSNYSKALKRKAQSFVQLGKFEDALYYYGQCFAIEKDQNLNREINDTKILLSQTKDLEKQMQRENYTEANQIVNQILKTTPEVQSVLMMQVEILAKLGFTERAQEIYLKHNSNWENVGPDIYYLAGLIELYNGTSEKAKKYFTEGMRLDPDNKKCMLALKKTRKCEELKEKGNQAIKENNYDDCIMHYNEALELDKSNKKLNSVIYANRALAYIKMKKYEQAVDDCSTSIELNDKYYKAYLRRAEARKELGQFEACVADYKKVKEIDPSQDVSRLIQEAKSASTQAKKKDYYGSLGIGKDATDAEVKKSYRKLALLWHPDRHKMSDEATKKQAESKFREISEAYSVLSDPKKKQLVDQGIDPENQNSGFEGFGGGGIDPTQIFSMFFGGGGMGGGGGSPFGDGFGGGNPFGSGGGGFPSGFKQSGGGGFPGGFSFKFQ